MGSWLAFALLAYPLVVWGLSARFGLPLLDALFLGALLSVLPILTLAQVPLLHDVPIERVPAYRASATTLVLLGGGAAFLGVRGGGWAGLGLGPMAPGPWAVWTFGVTAAGAALVLALYGLRRLAGVSESPLLARLIPATPAEKRAFVPLSFAAGFGEEITFRGYAIPVLAAHLGGEWGAALFTSAVFGLMHAYQGPLGMLRSALLGLLLAASFLVSGSLWPAIAAHTALDLLAGLVWGERLTR
jgi:uncharacterized protein